VGGEDRKAAFENLVPGNYYFCAREYGTSSYVMEGTGVTVTSRSRMNWYEVTIDLQRIVMTGQLNGLKRIPF
jgi:hypothetical protein